MLVIEINVIHAEASQRCIARRSYVLWLPAQPPVARIFFLAYICKFRRKKNFIPASAYRPPNQLLVVANSISIRGVQEINSQIERTQNRRRGLGIIPVSVKFAHPLAP